MRVIHPILGTMVVIVPNTTDVYTFCVKKKHIYSRVLLSTNAG